MTDLGLAGATCGAVADITQSYLDARPGIFGLHCGAVRIGGQRRVACPDAASFELRQERGAVQDFCCQLPSGSWIQSPGRALRRSVSDRCDRDRNRSSS